MRSLAFVALLAPPTPDSDVEGTLCFEGGGTYDSATRMCNDPPADGGAPGDAAASD